MKKEVAKSGKVVEKLEKEYQKNPTPENKAKLDKAKTTHEFNQKDLKRTGEKLETELGFRAPAQKEKDKLQAVHDYAASTATANITAVAVGDLKKYKDNEAAPYEVTMRVIDKAVKSSKVEEETTVYRGSRFVPNDVAVGQTLSSPTYSYSSKERDYAQRFANGEFEETGGKKGWLMRVKVPAGSSALDVNKTIGDQHETAFEQGILFPRGSKFTVTAVDKKTKTVEVVYEDNPTQNSLLRNRSLGSVAANIFGGASVKE